MTNFEKSILAQKTMVQKFVMKESSVRETAHFQLGEMHSKVRVYIQSSFGQIVSECCIENTSEIGMNFSKYPTGVYYVIIASNEKVKTIKVNKI